MVSMVIRTLPGVISKYNYGSLNFTTLATKSHDPPSRGEGVRV